MDNLKYITLTKILASVKNDFPSMDDRGFIDDSRLTKIVMLCNEKLGIPIYRKKEKLIQVRNFKADLPSDFWKIVFACAVECNSFGIANYRDPFNNTVTLEMRHDALCEASMEPDLTCSKECPAIIYKRQGTEIINQYNTWTPLSLSKRSNEYMHPMCPNTPGKYVIDINEETIDLPFREGEIYIMYFAAMEEDGEILVPFHPLISNWYEWCIKEKVLQDMMFNSDGDVSQKLQYASRQKALYWLDAVNFVSEPLFKELKEVQNRRDRKFYDQYFKMIM